MLGFSPVLCLGVHRWGLGGYGLFMLRFALTRAVVLVGGTAALALAGCTPSSPDEPTASPSVPVVSASPSVTVAPSETALSEEQLLELIPAEARTEDFPGAAAFAAFYWELYPRMFSGQQDSEEAEALWDLLGQEDCIYCASALNSLAEERADGLVRVGNDLEWSTNYPVGGLNNDGFWYVNLTATATGVETRDALGNVVESEPGFTGTFALRLAWTADGWVVHGAEIVPD